MAVLLAHGHHILGEAAVEQHQPEVQILVLEEMVVKAHLLQVLMVPLGLVALHQRVTSQAAAVVAQFQQHQRVLEVMVAVVLAVILVHLEQSIAVVAVVVDRTTDQITALQAAPALSF
jgi:hypothetical protein